MFLQLKMKVKVNSKAVKVKEVSKSGKDLQVGTQCEVTGWGVVSATGSMPSDTLQVAEVDILDRKLCDCFYNRNPVITQDMLCASNNKRQADACKVRFVGELIDLTTLITILLQDTDCVGIFSWEFVALPFEPVTCHEL